MYPTAGGIIGSTIGSAIGKVPGMIIGTLAGTYLGEKIRQGKQDLDDAQDYCREHGKHAPYVEFDYEGGPSPEQAGPPAPNPKQSNK